jgi:hypothetical protein
VRTRLDQAVHLRRLVEPKLPCGKAELALADEPDEQVDRRLRLVRLHLDHAPHDEADDRLCARHEPAHVDDGRALARRARDDVAAAVAEAVEARLEQRASDAVEDDVTASAGRQLAQFCGQPLGARVQHDLCAVRVCELALLGTRGGADDMRSGKRGQLAADPAEPACGGVDEYPFPRTHCAEAVDRVPGRDPVHEKSCRNRSCEVVRDRVDAVRRHEHVVGVRAALLEEADDACAGRRPSSARPDRRHRPGDLEPGHARQLLVAPVLAPAHHRVGEVDADGVDRDQRLAWPRPWKRLARRSELLGPAEAVGPPHGALGRE